MYDADLSGYLSLAELSEGLAKAMVNSKLRLISLCRIILGVFDVFVAGEVGRTKSVLLPSRLLFFCFSHHQDEHRVIG